MDLNKNVKSLSPEEIIDDLTKIIADKDRQIENLSSQLDKYQSIFSINGDYGVERGEGNNLRKVERAWGISAEANPPSTSDEQQAKQSIPKVFKTEKERHLLESAIRENNFLQRLKKTQVDEVVSAMKFMPLPADTFIIKEGDIGSILYVLEDGELEVSRKGTRMCSIMPGSVFGELAILYNCTRTATVKSLIECKLWAIERNIFKCIMLQTGLLAQKKYAELLINVPIFQNFSKEKIFSLADALEEVHYEPGSYIVRQYARGDTFYIISRGRVTVTRTSSADSQNEAFIRILEFGDFFGEKALESEEIRGTNIIASGEDGTDCLLLNRESYIQLVAKLKITETSNKIDIKDVELVVPDYLVKTSLNDLDYVATLGVGGFGNVDLVKLKDDPTCTFALKRMKKEHIVNTHQQEHVLNEKKVLSEVKSDFIIKLHKTYRDSKYLYMLMEVCLGGELWALLRNAHSFNDPTVRFYFACVIEALTHLHGLGIIYRDLKPENLIIDSKGYAKLVDFGFAKKIGMAKKTWTFCGTPEYVAPEIILNKGHDFAVDIWSLGIFTFELLTGSPPFSVNDPMSVYNTILRGIDLVFFPRFMSKNSQLLIKKLCRESPNDRLGYGPGGLQEIRKNIWFEGFDWEGVRRQSSKPPFIPRIQGSLDTSNFDKYSRDNAVPKDDLTGWDCDF